ncbi:MAG: hypothetical protein AAB847_01725 [Patescibacteria group bacterium]
MLIALLLSAVTIFSQSSPQVKRIEGERVRSEEVMIFTRSKLIEEGSAVTLMSGRAENINTVRYNMNTYRVGYSLASEKIDRVYMFTGPVKCWRSTSTGGISEWPEAKYPASRNETIRRAMLLKFITPAELTDEMRNLRIYYLPSLIDHDGKEYKVEPTAIAFFIHPETGNRMTVMIRDEHVYGSVNKPLSATSSIYIKDTKSYSAGPFGLGTAHVPYVFYSKQVQFDTEPFTEDNQLNVLIRYALNAVKEKQPLSAEKFQKIYNEMIRYTGGK